MKTFSLPNGATYGFDSNGRRICTGSQMGRRDILPNDPETPCKLRLIRLSFVDGDYDQWGAYWGAPANVYCATGEAGDIIAFVFARADSRQEAKAKVRESLPNARFFN